MMQGEPLAVKTLPRNQGKDRRARLLPLAATLLAGALLFYWSSVVALAPGATQSWDLQPEPDACEYFAAAVSLSAGEGYRIHLAAAALPPRYPPGYSLVQAAFLELGFNPLDSPFLVNKWAGLLLILGTFWWLRRRAHVLSAGLAALLTATSPAFIVATRSPMSEPLTALLSVIGLFMLYDGLRPGNLRTTAGAGFVLGLSTLFRTSNLFLAAAFALAPLGAVSGAWGHRTRFVLAYGAGAAAGIAPAWIYHLVIFGSPIATGYHYWVPFYRTWSNVFSLGHVPINLDYYFRELLSRGSTTTLADLYGEGTYFTFVLLAMALLALRALWDRPAIRSFAACGVLSMVPFALYSFQEARLIYPQLAALIPLVSVGSVRLLYRPSANWMRPVAGALLLAQLAIFPGRHPDPDFDRYLRGSRRINRPRYHDLTAYLASLRGNAPMLVLTDMNAPYVHAVLTGDRVVAPAFDESDYRWGEFQWTAHEREALVLSALAGRRQVFLLLKPRGADKTPSSPRLPDGWVWRVLDEAPDGGRVGVAQRLRPGETRDGLSISQGNPGGVDNR